jgi:hypothetical protein
MIGILGGGFGLYGYLPAASASVAGPILMPDRYREKFRCKPELESFSERVRWVDSDQAVIETATLLIVSKRPGDQFRLLPNLLAQSNIETIILEKPLAISPKDAQRMQELIGASDKKCNVGFIFRFLPWAKLIRKRLLNSTNGDSKIWHLKWHFMAHHYENNCSNWKREHSQGGGAIRFYGIHVIALLSEWGYINVNSSAAESESNGDGIYSWRAIFKGPGLPDFSVEIVSKSDANCFVVDDGNENNPLYLSKDPMDRESTRRDVFKIDYRCDYLEKLLAEALAQVEPWPLRLTQAIDLWSKVESHTTVKLASI